MASARTERTRRPIIRSRVVSSSRMREGRRFETSSLARGRSLAHLGSSSFNSIQLLARADLHSHNECVAGAGGREHNIISYIPDTAVPGPGHGHARRPSKANYKRAAKRREKAGWQDRPAQLDGTGLFNLGSKREPLLVGVASSRRKSA